MKIGKVHRVRVRDDPFFQYEWFALRAGVQDVIGFSQVDPVMLERSGSFASQHMVNRGMRSNRRQEPLQYELERA